MIFPTQRRVSLGSVGVGGGVRLDPVAALETPIQSMRWCLVCESEQIFVAGWECSSGLLGCCLCCSSESLVPFTRMVA